MTNYINNAKFTYIELFDEMFPTLSKLFHEALKNNLPGRLNISGQRVLNDSIKIITKTCNHMPTQKIHVSYNCKQEILIVIYLFTYTPPLHN